MGLVLVTMRVSPASPSLSPRLDHRDLTERMGRAVPQTSIS
jgi:hypothetical protein